jgi:hypothetical protein
MDADNLVLFQSTYDSKKGGLISKPNVVISAPFGVEITNSSSNFALYLLFPHHIVRK